jgi:tetratricopeptide (TPR) repeat protein
MSAFNRALAALACELGALGLAHVFGGIGFYLGLHALASVLVAVALLPLLPGNRRGSAALVYAFSINFFLPLVGVLGLLAAALLARFNLGPGIGRDFEVHASPTYDPRAEETAPVATRSGVRMRLANAALPTEGRLNALLTVQSMPARMSNPLIREMLSDPSEDLRLIAYGILDTREKTINARIHAAMRQIAGAPQRQRAALHKQLSELYYELIYQGLVQGSLRDHAAGEARSHLELAMAIDGADPALHALAAQIALSSGEYERARAALQRGLELGLPEWRVLPSLAELAFRTRRFDEVRALARRLATLPNTQGIERVLQYWRSA